eukprot:TRINITY_DN3545_c0_g1_i5.p1 TRINITY_DN3545_c0_g1~~TRINITY_DN3545_c0_g1_i5.p1  ORF type:complete len:166 (-),score=35.73 TRINITY_DN3545_c0_g1_i5:37-510(-)
MSTPTAAPPTTPPPAAPVPAPAQRATASSSAPPPNTTQAQTQPAGPAAPAQATSSAAAGVGGSALFPISRMVLPRTEAIMLEILAQYRPGIQLSRAAFLELDDAEFAHLRALAEKEGAERKEQEAKREAKEAAEAAREDARQQRLVDSMKQPMCLVS